MLAVAFSPSMPYKSKKVLKIGGEMKRFSTMKKICVFAIILINTSSVFAEIIDVSANWEFWHYHYSPIEFAAGTYKITPIGIADGGQYDAWNAWGAGEFSDCDDLGLCSRGYINSYSFGFVGQNDFVTEIATVGGSVADGTALAYQTPMLALANAGSWVFNLEHASRLYFYLRDGEISYGDNVGGMSLRIQAIPEPNTNILVLSGLLVTALSVLRHHRRVPV